MSSLENEKESKTLAGNIAWLRRENRLSKKETATLLGISVQAYHNLKKENCHRDCV